jgi:prepilin-type N-terminal cleavage/methylation domain-containing protein
MKKGFSLLEILVVLFVFSLLALVATQSLFLTLRGARKSESVVDVRRNLDYAVASIERQLHNASDIDPCEARMEVLSYTDQDQLPAEFSCVNIGDEGYVASSSARLTSDEVSVTSCWFECMPAVDGIPTSVTIDLSAKKLDAEGVEASMMTTSTKVYLRNY